MASGADGDADATRWRFVLYKAGENATGQRAEKTLRRLCEQLLNERYQVRVVDVMEQGAELPPDILAVPTVVRVAPGPEVRVVGDLSQAAKAAEWLGLTDAGRSDGR